MNIEGSIARTTVSDAVYRRLRDQILGSGAEAGAPLPSERTLSETFGVNRHAVAGGDQAPPAGWPRHRGARRRDPRHRLAP